MSESPLPVFVYSQNYNMDLGEHVFPAVKYRYIYDRLKQSDHFKNHQFVEPVPVTFEDAQLVHDRSYVQDLRELNYSKRVYRSELPLNRAIVDAFMLASGGTVLAAELALQNGNSMNLAGGFHHAFADHAEGFCYLNDVAIATRKLQNEKRVKKVLVIDLDVHQGNGTARIFRFSRSVFSFSMHEEKNYPVKEKGSLDVGLPTGMNDDEYIALLTDSLQFIEKKFSPDLIFYVAGVDPYEHDRLGGLSLTKEGMKERDRVIRDFLPGIPRCTVLAGGYALDPMDTVDLHVQTCEVLAGTL